MRVSSGAIQWVGRHSRASWPQNRGLQCLAWELMMTTVSRGRCSVSDLLQSFVARTPVVLGMKARRRVSYWKDVRSLKDYSLALRVNMTYHDRKTSF